MHMYGFVLVREKEEYESYPKAKLQKIYHNNKSGMALFVPVPSLKKM